MLLTFLSVDTSKALKVRVKNIFLERHKTKLLSYIHTCMHTYIHKSFIKKMTERINLTMKKWTKCNENNTH